MESESAQGSRGRGPDTPGPAVWTLQETRDVPLSRRRDLVGLLHSLATTLEFLQNAHSQVLP